MKYRDRIDIISQILEVANRGDNATRSKIMYKALLSYAQMKEYLMLLTEKNLLRYDEDTQTFKTTEKGFRFLLLYNQIVEMIKTPRQRQQVQMWWISRGKEEEV
jgi:predicted transcriptional regulator